MELAIKEADEEGKSVQSRRGVFIEEREHERSPPISTSKD